MADEDPTPIRRQYLDVKRQYPGTIVFFRLGDFYETFDGDAELVSRELDLVLTGRNVAKGQRVPMAGIPYHAVEGYIAKLIGRGYHVAICEQVSTQAVKGLFRREVVRVVTPGTIVEPGLLEAERNNYLAALAANSAGDRMALAHVDITTGEFAATQAQGPDCASAIRLELLRLRPAELLLSDGEPPAAALEGFSGPRTRQPGWKFEPGHGRNILLAHFKVASLAGFGLDGSPLVVAAAAAILQYLQDTQPAALGLLTGLSVYTLDDFMVLDASTRRNLELTETLRSAQEKGSLLGVLDQTATPMGARLLRQWVTQPLLDQAAIEQRLDRVAAFAAAGLLRAEVRAALKPLADLERITNRVVGNNAHPRDLVAMRATLAALPPLLKLLTEAGQPDSPLAALASQVDVCAEVLELLNTGLAEDPPAVLSKPGVVRRGYSAELDGIISASQHAREWIAGLEKVERERTGIKSLKVSYNKVFGYYIELSRGQSENAPDNYIRKQTLVNAERYITPELKEYETLVLNAEERILDVETRLFRDMCAEIGRSAGRLLCTARALAQLDVHASLAEVAARNRYCRPQLAPSGQFDIRNGRHPVVEQLLPEGERFVPNDIVFEPNESVRVITGPNMSGKCVTGDTLVYTDAGLLPIARLRPADAPVDTFASCHFRVKGLDGPAEATHFYNGGRRPTIRIKTRLGYTLEGTREHRLWVRFPGGAEGWKALGEIGPGDFVSIDRQLDLWGGQTAIDAPMANALPITTSLKRYHLPTELAPELAYILGLLLGDGTLTYRNYVALTSGDPSIVDEFARVVQEVFGYSVQRVAREHHYDCRIGSRQIRLFLEELGLGYVTATAKCVPVCILAAPKGVVRAFLQGLFDTDGTADQKGNVSLSTSSSEMAHQVHCLLLNFGIVASLQTKKGVHSVNPAYQVSIYGVEAARFYTTIGFRLERKQARAARVSALRMPNVGGIPYLAAALKEVQGHIVAKPNKPVALKRNKSVNSIFYTYLPTNRNVSYFKLDELLAYCDQNGVAYPELETLAARRYFYDPVVEVAPGEAEVFDLSVAGAHAFVANGMVNHNSTYLRQAALIALMAQMGSFVPADSAELGIVDRIFTRIGAQDEIHAGQSTFMVEMVETANILHHATSRSLLVLDEIGRGTSTYDGLSLAWAIVEYIHNHPRLKSKTLFATHYHELTDLAGLLPGVRNYNVAVAENTGAGEDNQAERVVFLHRIIPGGADRSYGIHVAQLAGLPRAVINRAQQILAELEASGGRAVRHTEQEAPAQQMALFPETNPLVTELQQLDLNAMMPVEALNKLFEWKARYTKGRDPGVR
jgi:DNA mismatch repair protein MutS